MILLPSADDHPQPPNQQSFYIMEARNEGPRAVFPPMTKGLSLRRKLQKRVSKQQPDVASQRGSGVSIQAAANSEGVTIKNISAPQLQHPGSPVPSPGSNRIELARRNGFYYEPVSPPPRSDRRPAPPIVPELSHLVTSNPQPQPPPSPASAATSVPRTRRRAKTPIFSIGQLEALPRPGNNTTGRTSSVDLIARQYTDLLESRPDPTYADADSEPPSPRSGKFEERHGDRQKFEERHDDRQRLPIRRRHSSINLREETLHATPKHLFEPPSAAVSPTSDDGTLVSFDDDAVYFKPFSFGEDEPGSPRSPHPPPTDRRRPSADGGNVSLQICVDLLTRELASAFVERPSRPSLSTSALQVWVMIEAYEKLRDRLAESRHVEGLGAVELMFDVWLRALCAIHDSMTGCGKMCGVDAIAELGTEDLD